MKTWQKNKLEGLSLEDAKRRVWESFSASSGAAVVVRRGLQITARTAAKNIEVEVDKPLGLTLGQKQGGGVIITVSYPSFEPQNPLPLSYPSFNN